MRDSGHGQLLKVLGVAFGVAVIVGNTILIGILRTPGDVATRLPDAWLFLSVWLAGGIYACLGAATLAEPGAMLAQSGGQYVIVRRGLGEYPGFVVGWSDWISTCGTVALGGMVIAEYLSPLNATVAEHQRLVACIVVTGFGLLLWRGVKAGDVAQQTLSALKSLAFAALIGVCLFLAAPAHATGSVVAIPTGLGFAAAIVLALQAVIYTYDGWTGPLYFLEEVTDPGRQIPRAMLTGVLTVIVIYLLLNIGILKVLGIAQMAGDPFVAATAGKALFGEKGDLVIRLLVLLSIAGGINACLMMAPRVMLAMSRDRLVPHHFEIVNAGGTPSVAHWASVGVALAMILTGRVDTVLALCAFFFVANYSLSFLSVFALRRTEPDTPRPYRVPLHPWTTGFVLLVSVAFLAGSILSDWGNSRQSLILLGLSLPVYLLIGRMRGVANTAGEARIDQA